MSLILVHHEGRLINPEVRGDLFAQKSSRKRRQVLEKWQRTRLSTPHSDYHRSETGTHNLAGRLKKTTSKRDKVQSKGSKQTPSSP